MKKSIVVAGGSGLVGQELLKILSERPDVECISLVRSSKGANLPHVRDVEFDFTSKQAYERIGSEFPCDVFFCCLGTTLKKAGSAESFRKVDRDLPLAFLERLSTLPHKPLFAFISSVGSDKPRGLYLKTKWEVEQAIFQSGLPYVVARPSLLLGLRGEFRLGEKIAMICVPPVFDLMFALTSRPPQSLVRYAPIEAVQVAQALVQYSLDEPAAAKVVEGRELFEA